MRMRPRLEVSALRPFVFFYTLTAAALYPACILYPHILLSVILNILTFASLI